MRYMIKRRSRSGGMEYLVNAIYSRGYRWDKVAAEKVHYFTSKATARQNARKYEGTMVVAEFPVI